MVRETEEENKSLLSTPWDKNNPKRKWFRDEKDKIIDTIFYQYIMYTQPYMFIRKKLWEGRSFSVLIY